MKAQANKSRPTATSGRKRPATAPLTQMLVLDALKTWVVPTVAAVGALVAFVTYNVGVVEQATAVTAVGGAALVVVLFAGLRGFLDEAPSVRLAAVLVAFTLLWSAATFLPFYRALNPGTPVFSTDLTRNGPRVTVPLHGKPGHYSMIAEAHFLPVEGKQNRTVTYHIAVGHEGSTDRVIEGAFSQEWGSQRVGAGRRSSLVPVMHQTTQVLDVLDDPDGRDLTMQLTDLSPGVRDNLTVRVYSETLPKPVWIALGMLAVAAAVLLDAWREKGDSEGLLATLTLAVFIALVTFRASAVASPGFPQLVIAALVGTLVGAIGGSLLWRLSRPILKYLPERP